MEIKSTLSASYGYRTPPAESRPQRTEAVLQRVTAAQRYPLRSEDVVDVSLTETRSEDLRNAAAEPPARSVLRGAGARYAPPKGSIVDIWI